MSTHTDTTATTSIGTIRRPGRRHLGQAAAALAAAVLLAAAAACSKNTDVAGPTTTVAPARSVPPPTSAPPATPATSPPATTAPPTTAPPTTSEAVGAARRALLRGILESHRTAGDFVGARMAVRDRDGTVTEVTSGTQTVDPASPPVDPAAPWNIGSATKTFVAIVVLQLADEGRVGLDDGIGRYFPNLPGADRITPRELLQHTSGLNEYLDKPAVVNDLKRTWTPDELIAVAEAAGRIGQPGGPHHYANTNYIVLGELIEKVTGHPWDDEVRIRIVEPLGMTGTTLITDQIATGYKPIGGKLVDTTNSADPSVGGAAGALQSTDHDLLLLATALADGTLLSPASRRAMETFVPAEDYSQFGIDHGYGLGLERYVSKDITVIGHMGTGETQSAYVGFDPDRGTAVAVQTNVAVPGPQAMMAVEALTAVSQES